MSRHGFIWIGAMDVECDYNGSFGKKHCDKATGNVKNMTDYAIFWNGALFRGRGGPRVFEKPARHLPRQGRGFVRPPMCPMLPTGCSRPEGHLMNYYHQMKSCVQYTLCPKTVLFKWYNCSLSPSRSMSVRGQEQQPDLELFHLDNLRRRHGLPMRSRRDGRIHPVDLHALPWQLPATPDLCQNRVLC